ncbi:hypothetical protein [Kiloniella sp. EL199]|uniref:hypothetical protein n=1 Tax=Kiloniella sp. EL199 TaxID=2107581 RepID=UPI001C1F5852|nr:hypothetical protein [Kiloniella sp. EL199]
MGGTPQRDFIDYFSVWDFWMIPLLFVSGSLILPLYLKPSPSGIRAFNAGVLTFGTSYLLMFVMNKIRGFFIYPFPFDEKDFLVSYLIGGSGYILIFACLGGGLIMLLSFLKRV